MILRKEFNIFCITPKGTVAEELDFIIKDGLLITNNRLYRYWFGDRTCAEEFANIRWVDDGGKLLLVEGGYISNDTLVKGLKLWERFSYSRDEIQAFIDRDTPKWCVSKKRPIPELKKVDHWAVGYFKTRKEAIDFIIKKGWDKHVWWCSMQLKPRRVPCQYIDYNICNGAGYVLDPRFLFNTKHEAEKAWTEVCNAVTTIFGE